MGTSREAQWNEEIGKLWKAKYETEFEKGRKERMIGVEFDTRWTVTKSRKLPGKAEEDEEGSPDRSYHLAGSQDYSLQLVSLIELVERLMWWRWWRRGCLC